MNKEEYDNVSTFEKIDFDIAIEMYDKHNSTIAGINDHLGEIYSCQDLKELEKYGFNKIKDCITDKYYAYLKHSLRINISNKKLTKNDAHFNEYDLDIVYDLIKDGLVEKVE